MDLHTWGQVFCRVAVTAAILWKGKIYLLLCTSSPPPFSCWLDAYRIPSPHPAPSVLLGTWAIQPVMPAEGCAEEVLAWGQSSGQWPLKMGWIQYYCELSCYMPPRWMVGAPLSCPAGNSSNSGGIVLACHLYIPNLVWWWWEELRPWAASHIVLNVFFHAWPPELELHEVEGFNKSEAPCSLSVMAALEN